MRLEELFRGIEEKLKEIPYVDKLIGIKGIGLATVSGRGHTDRSVRLKTKNELVVSRNNHHRA